MAKSGTIKIWLVDKAPRSQYYWGEGSMFAVANHLTGYFNAVCQHPSSPFENSYCSWQPGSVAEKDLVIYFLKSPDKSIINSRFSAVSPCTAPSGGTFESNQGMISEVYMDTMEGDRDYCKLVANLAFHELMHNKMDASTSGNTVNDLHTSGGGGLAQAKVVRDTPLSTQNIALLAGALGKNIKQFTALMT
jgi:hypothetical protein